MWRYVSGELPRLPDSAVEVYAKLVDQLAVRYDVWWWFTHRVWEESGETSRGCRLLALDLEDGDVLATVGLVVGERVADDEEDLRELFEVEAVLGDKRPQLRHEAYV